MFHDAEVFIIESVIFLLLTLITILGSVEIKRAIEITKNDKNKSNALKIALIMGIITSVVIFKQKFLIEIPIPENIYVYTIFFILSFIFGWMVWNIVNIDTYGDFIHIFIITIGIAIAWYAKLTDIKWIQTLAVGMIVGSLLRTARDFLVRSAATKGDSAQSSASD